MKTLEKFVNPQPGFNVCVEKRIMNNKSYLVTYLITLVGGIALVVLNGRARLFDAIAVLIGIIFLVLGVVSLLGSFRLTKADKAAGRKPSVSLAVAFCRCPRLRIANGFCSGAFHTLSGICHRHCTDIVRRIAVV